MEYRSRTWSPATGMALVFTVCFALKCLLAPLVLRLTKFSIPLLADRMEADPSLDY